MLLFNYKGLPDYSLCCEISKHPMLLFNEQERKKQAEIEKDFKTSYVVV